MTIFSNQKRALSPVEGGGGGQEEDQVHRHEQRDGEVEVEAVRGGLDEALAETIREV